MLAYVEGEEEGGGVLEELRVGKRWDGWVALARCVEVKVVSARSVGFLHSRLRARMHTT
jgi:hypothetical protein